MSPTLRQAPWVTTMPVSPGGQRVEALAQRGRIRSRTCADDSSPRTRTVSSCGQPGGVLAGVPLGELLAGQARPHADVVLAQPSVGLDRQARRPRRRTPPSPAPGPGRWTTAATGPSAARCGAAAAAWARPTSSREMSA